MVGKCSATELVLRKLYSLKFLPTAFILVDFAMAQCTYTHTTEAQGKIC